MGKIDDLKAYKEWSEYYKSLQTDKAVDDLTPTQRRAMLDKLERNPIEWISFFFVEFCRYPFTSFHKCAIRRICGNPEWYEVLSWSRELAKSTIVFMCVMYLVCTGKKRNVLLASFRALGALESPRGSRKDAVRPDVVLVDDYDTDAECRNPDIVKKKWEWFESALLPTRSVSEPFLVVWCGNIIALNCCTRLAGERADNWDVINIPDKHGRSTWPEKNSEAHIDRIIKTMSTRAFQQEYCNNPLAEGETFKELTWGKCPPLSKLRFAVAYGDPAPSNSKNKTTSFKAVFLIGYHDGNFYVYTGYLDHVTNDEYVNWYYYIRDYVNDKTQVYNYIENNKLQDPFYEQVFMPLFTAKGKTNGFIGIIPDTRKKPEKFDRIEGNLEPLNRQGRLILNVDERDNPHMRRLEEQFLLVNRAMKSPADGVDCVEGGVWIVNQKITTLTSGSYTIGQRRVNKKRF